MLRALMAVTAAACLSASAADAATGAGAAPLVQDGVSEYVIYCDPAAPRSVTQAAAELRDYLEQVSGAELPVVHRPGPKMICVGDNAASREAGLTTAQIPWEGFRIVTKDANVYVLGRDTADGQRTPGGGASNGTLNGAYAFIERFLGVRWLAPGDHGDYVPKSPAVIIPATDISDAPAFLNRRLPYTQERRPEVVRWQARQRLGKSLSLAHHHNWRASIPASHFDQHPDWFAERSGVRVPPAGRYKLCTTNPGLIRAYADAAIAYFDAHPDESSYSLSPSDSAGYCECEQCAALYETDPNGKRSVTPAILTFYNAVAKLVGEQHPQKTLAGFVYAEYLFPPKKNIRLEPNVFLVWAPSFDYGFTLARPRLRRQWEEVLAGWTEVTANISYYDLPVNIETEAGVLNPPGLEILKFMYPRLQGADIKGVYVYGIAAWGRAGPLNYLLAKLAWDPQANVEELFDEYCAKAYGAGGDDINRLYRLVDREVARHYREFPDTRYSLTTDMMRDVYAKNLTEIERLYRAAESKTHNPDARARLRMIGDNLIVMHWNLRQRGVLDAPRASSFYLSDPDFFAFLAANKGSLALHPTAMLNPPAYVRKRLSVAVPEKPVDAEAGADFRLRGQQHLVLRPSGAGPVEVGFGHIQSRGELVTYNVYGPDGSEVASGVMSADAPVVLEPADMAYYHLTISARSASFAVHVSGAAWGVDGNLSDEGLHLLGRSSPVYFYVPEAAPPLHLSLGAAAPGETAVATLFAPSNRRVAEFDCSATPVDRKQIETAPEEAGWWKLDIRPAPTGGIDDVRVSLEGHDSGYFSLVPDQALQVQ
ncbi:hypothetical protein Pla175_37430 [Pirellulimonas nuda]|uniref:Alpha glucuronidase N-terminal domain-containing protein n=1 Tax=Pirellulimonas nuda TaxID=2528009 RepID=A0A518DFU1_9BACT|nr:DUF4838 domain-containing protein [Pirellulimonas nuda]QDU90339.1 hypothetical protein Pla175_37430 [Pirellulimonas nuda]